MSVAPLDVQRTVIATPTIADPPSRLDRITALELELADLRQRQRDDDDLYLLALIARNVGLRRTFDGATVIAFAADDPDLAGTLTGWSVRRLGKRFERIRDRDLSGFRLSRVKNTATGWVYVLNFHEDHRHAR